MGCITKTLYEYAVNTTYGVVRVLAVDEDDAELRVSKLIPEASIGNIKKDDEITFYRQR